MTKIVDLPSIVSTETLYYDGCVLVTNGYDGNGDYVTGQITAVTIIDEYINHKIDWNSSVPRPEDQFLYATYYNSDNYYLCGLSIDDLASNIASSISDNNYLYDYISSSINDYVYGGYLSYYLSEFISNYVAEGKLNSYITSQIGSYVNNMSTRSYTSEISGIVVKDYNELAYIDGSNFAQIINNCIYYESAYPHSLDDYTQIVGMISDFSENMLAPITLGDIVSYVKSHL